MYSIETGTAGCFIENAEAVAVVENFVMDWFVFKAAIFDYRESANRDVFFTASESNYTNASQTIKSLNEHMIIDGTSVDLMQYVLIGNGVILLVLLVVIFLNTHKELEKNKTISEEMYLDTATGIFNRAKCQEILKITSPAMTKERAVIVFDLNDLKKTNDTLGHRAGDELIYDFAQQIKNATKSFENEIFVGRYGGDEFMAYLDEVEEQDVRNYIEEVYNVLNHFNDTKNKPYQLSCAAGYGISAKENKMLTVRELFDVADEDMFRNKVAMKEKRRKELLSQGVEVLEYVDDRL